MSDYIPYGTDPDMDLLVDSNNWKERYSTAKKGYGLDRLSSDKNYNVAYTAKKMLTER